MTGSQMPGVVWHNHSMPRLMLRRVAIPAAALVGALLSWQSAAHEIITTKITFNKEIVRILAKNCLGCHRAGGIAPMSLATYAEARPWAKAIKEEVLERRMPPWHAVSGYNEFANDRRLADREVDLITAWVDGGAPKGDDKDLPPQSASAGGEWPLGEPDLVLQPERPFSVRAEGDDEYRCFVLPYRAKEERWVRAVDLRPGAPSVVHHAFVWIDRSGRAGELAAADPDPGYACFGGPGFAPAGSLGAWVPGQRPAALASGLGYLVPAGARLVMQVHYHRSGSAESDLTRLGLYFSKAPVEKRVRETAVINPKLEIPPGEPAYPVRAAYTFQQDVEALSVLPHMHLLGKSMEVTAVRPDGTREVLVWVRDYDFNWQTTYSFKKPVRLPRGTRIEVVAIYDNSERNPRNPNKPPKPVRWGESTTDEMCVAYLEYVLASERLTQTAAR